MKLNVQGNRAVIKGFSDFEKKIADKVRDRLTEWAVDTESLAISRVPVDTGYLKSTIHKESESDGLVWAVGTPVDYAPYVEFGTGTMVDVPTGLEDYAIQFKGAGIKEVNLPARPFLFNSAREEFELMIQELKENFK